MPGVPLVGTGVKLLSVPPVTTTSLISKSSEASESLKLMVSLAPAASVVPALVRETMMLGAVVSAGMAL